MISQSSAQDKLLTLARGRKDIPTAELFAGHINMFDTLMPVFGYFKSEVQTKGGRLKQSLPPRSLYANQAEVNTDTLLKKLGERRIVLEGMAHPSLDMPGKKIPPVGFKYKGRVYILDGHHRVAEAILLEYSTVVVWIVDLDRMPKPPADWNK